MQHVFFFITGGYPAFATSITLKSDGVAEITDGSGKAYMLDIQYIDHLMLISTDEIIKRLAT